MIRGRGEVKFRVKLIKTTGRSLRLKNYQLIAIRSLLEISSREKQKCLLSRNFYKIVW